MDSHESRSIGLDRFARPDAQFHVNRIECFLGAAGAYRKVLDP
jgi:hypothetical protein